MRASVRYLLTLLLIWPLLSQGSANTLLLPDSLTRLHLQPWTDYLATPKGRLPVEALQQQPAEHWQPASQQIPRCHDGSYCGWIRIRLHNSSTRDRTLIIDSSIHQQWYSRYQQRYQPLQRRAHNDGLAQILKDRNNSFTLQVPAHSTVELYGHFRSAFTRNVFHTQLWSVQAFVEHRARAHLQDGAYFGLIFGLILFNLSLFVINREKHYLYYCGFQTAVVCQVFTGTVYYQALFYDAMQAATVVWGLSGVATTTLYAIFTLSIFRLRSTHPGLARLWRRVLQLQVAILVLMTGLLIHPASWLVAITIGLFWLGAIYLLVIEVITLVRCRSSAQLAWPWFLASMFQQLALNSWLLSESADGLPDHINLVPLVQLATLLDAAILSWMLAWRLRQERNQRQQAQQSLIEEMRQKQLMGQECQRTIATIGHELHQPLQSLVLQLEQMQRSCQPCQQPLLTTARESAAQLSQLLRHLLELARQQNTTGLSMNNVALAPLLEQLRQEFYPQSQQQQLQLRIDPSALTVSSNALMLGQILRNLLSNALRYTQAGEVRVSVIEAGRHAEISVTDTGPGIDRQQQAHIFEAFYQTSTGRNQPGYGMGLNIVRTLSQQLGVELTLDSTPGQGSCFRLRVPLAASSNPQQPALQQTRQALGTGQHQILLVSDNEEIRSTLLQLLRTWKMPGQALTPATLPQAGNSKVAILILQVEDTTLRENSSLTPLLENNPAIILLQPENPQIQREQVSQHSDGPVVVLPGPLNPMLLRSALAQLKQVQQKTEINLQG